MIINISQKKVIIVEFDEEDMDNLLAGKKLVRILCDDRYDNNSSEEIEIYCSNPRINDGN